LPIVIALLLVRAFLFDVFHVPTDSMVPALQPGDRIWVNRLAYGLRWPLSGEPLAGASLPRRGEIVVFRYPREPSTAFVKRVLAVPGDRVRIDGRRIELNGRALLAAWPQATDTATQPVELDGIRFAVRADFANRPRIPLSSTWWSPTAICSCSATTSTTARTAATGGWSPTGT
jgi:signal peptidase I